METLRFTGDDGKETAFEVYAEVKLSGINYLLVAEDTDDDEAEALILKEVSAPDAEEAHYAVVTDETVTEALRPLFAEMLDEDVSIEA